MILSFGQTVLGKQCSPRSDEQSDKGLHSLPFHLHVLDALFYVKTTFFFKFYDIYNNFLGVRIF